MSSGAASSMRAAMRRRWAAQKSRALAQRVRYNPVAAMQGTWVPLAGDLSVPRSLPESQGRQVGKEDI
jgi:hypothetical protein